MKKIFEVNGNKIEVEMKCVKNYPIDCPNADQCLYCKHNITSLSTPDLIQIFEDVKSVQDDLLKANENLIEANNKLLNTNQGLIKVNQELIDINRQLSSKDGYQPK